MSLGAKQKLDIDMDMRLPIVLQMSWPPFEGSARVTTLCNITDFLDSGGAMLYLSTGDEVLPRYQ